MKKLSLLVLYVIYFYKSYSLDVSSAFTFENKMEGEYYKKCVESGQLRLNGKTATFPLDMSTTPYSIPKAHVFRSDVLFNDVRDVQSRICFKVGFTDHTMEDGGCLPPAHSLSASPCQIWDVINKRHKDKKSQPRVIRVNHYISMDKYNESNKFVDYLVHSEEGYQFNYVESERYLYPPIKMTGPRIFVTFSGSRRSNKFYLVHVTDNKSPYCKQIIDPYLVIDPKVGDGNIMPTCVKEDGKQKYSNDMYGIDILLHGDCFDSSLEKILLIEQFDGRVYNKEKIYHYKTQDKSPLDRFEEESIMNLLRGVRLTIHNAFVHTCAMNVSAKEYNKNLENNYDNPEFPAVIDLSDLSLSTIMSKDTFSVAKESSQIDCERKPEEEHNGYEKGPSGVIDQAEKLSPTAEPKHTTVAEKSSRVDVEKKSGSADTTARENDREVSSGANTPQKQESNENKINEGTDDYDDHTATGSKSSDIDGISVTTNLQKNDNSNEDPIMLYQSAICFVGAAGILTVLGAIFISLAQHRGSKARLHSASNGDANV